MPAFERTARSFRALDSEERAGIHERRVHVVQASAGESLATLAQRSGNVWKLDEVAIANGLEKGAAPAPGQRVKVVVERPYTRGGRD